ncbi:hypothetical protein MPSEU_000947100 [Mayamaea pseudoterrestris]|nr:hypothetical protein MPSEU_000947100 [Mayamaea pseudoterrestris]
MVKHARSKKRRAGRIGKVKLKNPSWNRWNPNPKIQDPILKQHWDPSVSPAENMRRMGLRFDPNAKEDRNDDQPVTSRVIELFDVPDSDKPSRRSQFPLKEDEEEYIVKAMAKHGTNYNKMFYDLKSNPLQHTREKLTKMGARYLLLEPHQRRIEVPENVKLLLPSAS